MKNRFCAASLLWYCFTWALEQLNSYFSKECSQKVEKYFLDIFLVSRNVSWGKFLGAHNNVCECVWVRLGVSWTREDVPETMMRRRRRRRWCGNRPQYPYTRTSVTFTASRSFTGYLLRTPRRSLSRAHSTLHTMYNARHCTPILQYHMHTPRYVTRRGIR